MTLKELITRPAKAIARFFSKTTFPYESTLGYQRATKNERTWMIVENYVRMPLMMLLFWLFMNPLMEILKGTATPHAALKVTLIFFVLLPLVWKSLFFKANSHFYEAQGDLPYDYIRLLFELVYVTFVLAILNQLEFYSNEWIDVRAAVAISFILWALWPWTGHYLTPAATQFWRATLRIGHMSTRLWKRGVHFRFLVDVAVFYVFMSLAWGTFAYVVYLLMDQTGYSVPSVGLFDFYYFSSLLMFSVGYGQMLPTHPITKILASFESLFSIVSIPFVLGYLLNEVTSQIRSSDGRGRHNRGRLSTSKRNNSTP